MAVFEALGRALPGAHGPRETLWPLCHVAVMQTDILTLTLFADYQRPAVTGVGSCPGDG